VKPTTTLALALLSAGLAGCAGTGSPSPYVGWFKGFDTCRAEYEALDARVAAAGVGDPAYYRIPGYPFLRTDRLLASYAYEVKGLDDTAGWIRRMREFDQEAREFEYGNLGMAPQERGILRDRLLNCGRTLVTLELDAPAAIDKLRAAVAPPDEYSGTARTLGLYPLAVPLLKSRLEAERATLLADFARPLEQLDASGPLVLWKVSPKKDPALIENGFATALTDELGIPGLVESQWQALAEKHAPGLWIETASERDRPGAPIWNEQGPSVDPERPLVNYSVSFARFGGNPVVHLTYFLWFKDSPIDGTVWRVTLDNQARPLVYENVHTSGRLHQWFPVQPLERKPRDGYWQEPALIPQDQAPAQGATLRLQAGTHRVRRVVAVEQAVASETRTYELRRYEDLYSLPRPGGGTRSLFGPDGVVAGTERPDPS
jgi:hypothetical protein